MNIENFTEVMDFVYLLGSKVGKVTSKERLATCHEDLQQVINRAIRISSVDFGVAEGHRSIERQQELFNAGKSKINGIDTKGKHNYVPSQAVDIYGWVNGHINYDTNVLCYLAGVILTCGELIGVKLRWGGNWDMDGVIITDQSFDDLVHFEI